MVDNLEENHPLKFLPVIEDSSVLYFLNYDQGGYEAVCREFSYEENYNDPHCYCSYEEAMLEAEDINSVIRLYKNKLERGNTYVEL